jgi:hypothetical protein
MAERLSRKDLFELVWSEQMENLAFRFGVSDVALKNLCASCDSYAGPWLLGKGSRKENLSTVAPAAPPGMDDEVVVRRGGHYRYQGHLVLCNYSCP